MVFVDIRNSFPVIVVVVVIVMRTVVVSRQLVPPERIDHVHDDD